MKITKERLKEIIKEEAQRLNERFEPEPYTVGSLRELAAKGDPEKEVQIKHRYGSTPFDIYEAYTTDDGRVIITVQERE
tara:strand:+ start:17 stop:253 length:237 start_codon:yes stop_codon:yes gene_type:complete